MMSDESARKAEEIIGVAFTAHIGKSELNLKDWLVKEIASALDEKEKEFGAELKKVKDAYSFYKDWEERIELGKRQAIGYMKQGLVPGVQAAALTKAEGRAEAGKYVIVRTYSAGVFAGTLHSRNGREVVLKNARRLWYWAGAASLSQMAMEGTKNPSNCKFPREVDRVELLQCIEILNVTPKAEKSIKEVPIWRV